jgi:hypothetical protein
MIVERTTRLASAVALTANARLAREEIHRLSGDVILMYRRSAKERAGMHRAGARSRASRALDLGEMIGDSVQGYAVWIIRRGSHPDPSTALHDLSQLRTFHAIVNAAGFPAFRRYLIFVDYLRGRLIQYLTDHQLGRSVTV